MDSSRSAYHHGDLAQALVEQALSTLVLVNSEELSLRAISQAIGVSHSAAYRHFPNKRALLDGVCELGFARFRDALLEAKGLPTTPLPARFEQMCEAYVSFALANANLYSLMFGPGFVERMYASDTSATASEAFAVLLSSVQEGLASGLFAPANPFFLSQTIWALLHGFALFALHGEVSPEHGAVSAKRSWHLLYRGIAA